MPITKIRNNYVNLYVIGVIIATGLCIMLLIVTERENKKKVVKDELQPGMVVVLGLMSWFLL